MARREENRIFVGGLAWNTTVRDLEGAFAGYGNIREARVMLERDTGRSRGFGFITFADQWAMEDAISEMHGQELDGRVISVNEAQPKMGGDDPGYRYVWDHMLGGRDSYRGGDRPVGRSDCFRCGRPGHFAKECPGGGRFSPHSRFGGGGGCGDRFGVDCNDDSFDGGRYGDRDHVDSRDSRYGNRDRYSNDRYLPGDCFAGNRYMDRDPQNGYSKDRSSNREGGLRGGGDRELLHTKKRQEDTYDHLKAVLGDAMISCDRYSNDKYSPGNRFAGNIYMDWDPQNGYGKDRSYNREGGLRDGGDRELLHTKKRREDTYDHLKAVLGDAMIGCDREMVGPGITVCSQASSFLPSVINEDELNFEIPDGHSSASLSSNSASIIMDNSLSPAHTLVQIVCQDHKGLLYDIMRILKDYNIQISYGRCTSKQGRNCEYLFIVQADGKKIVDPNKQNALCSRLRMELLRPLRVAVVSRGPDTELLVANPVELSGKGRPLVFYDITLALKMLKICIFSAEIGRYMIGDREWEVYRVLLEEGDRLSVPRKKIEEGVWKMLMCWE